MKLIIEILVRQKFIIITLFMWLFEIISCKLIAQPNSIQIPVNSSYMVFNGQRVALKEYCHPSSYWDSHHLSLTSDGVYIINSNKGIFQKFTLRLGLFTNVYGKKIYEENIFRAWWHPKPYPVYTGNNAASTLSIDIESYNKETLQEMQNWFAFEDQGSIYIQDTFQVINNKKVNGKLIHFRNLHLKYVNLDENLDDSTYRSPVFPDKYLSGKLFVTGGIVTPQIRKSQPEKLLSSGFWNKDTKVQCKGGQGMHFEVKNTNILPTTIIIDSNVGGSQSLIIPPLSTVNLSFSCFGEEPIDWTFDISTNNDVFIVTWKLFSTWVPKR